MHTHYYSCVCKRTCMCVECVCVFVCVCVCVIIIIIIGFIAHTKLQMVGTRVANKVNSAAKGL